MTTHPPIDYPDPETKTLSQLQTIFNCGKFTRCSNPFQLLCSESSQIPAGWPLKRVERRTSMKADQSRRISSIQFPAKGVLSAVAPNYAGMGAAQRAAPPAILALSPSR